MRYAKNREHLYDAIGSFIQQITNARAIFRVSISDESAGNVSGVEVVKSSFKELPENLEQWAVRLALLSTTQDQPSVEVDPATHQIVMIAFPVFCGDNNVESIISLFVKEDASRNDSSIALEMATLQSAVNAVERWDAKQKGQVDRRLAIDTAAINEISANLVDSSNIHEGCQRLADELSNYLKKIQTASQELVDQVEDRFDVFVATVDSNFDIRLMAMANADSLPDDSKLIELVESTVGECLCHGCATKCLGASDTGQALLCHQQFAKFCDTKTIDSIPVFDQQGVPQVVFVIAAKSELSDRQRLFSMALADTIGSEFRMIRRAQQNRVQRIWTATCESIQNGKGKFLLKLVAGALCLSLIPMPYRVASLCEIKPTEKRFVCAPFATRLESCLVEPGDRVKRGQVLARLDPREIDLELTANEAELYRARKNRDGFIASHESGKARLAELEAERLFARNKLLRYQKEHLELQSPIDGIVISGDLTDAIGMPLEIGQSLFEVAPHKDLVVEVMIPENDVRHVQEKMNVGFRFEAFPFESFQGAITNIHPASEIRNDKNVFIALSNVQGLPAEARPGMTGTAKIKTKWRPIIWIYLHKPAAASLRWMGW